MSTRAVWSADPFMRDVYLDPADRATVAALLTRHQADDLADMLGVTGDTTA